MKFVLAFLLFTLQTFAQTSENTQFLSYLKNEHALAPDNFRTEVVYDYDANQFDVEESLYEQLLAIAESQSQIWGDTILEGDVWSLGEIRIDHVELLKDGNELLGYRITYSQKGWDTSSCDLSRATTVDYEREETFAQCAEGRIYESSYATADLNTYFADHNALATLELAD